jgi:hypothetical protein
VPLGLVAVFWLRQFKPVLQGRPPADAQQCRLGQAWLRQGCVALELLKRNQLFCVWTGQKLKEEYLDIDHQLSDLSPSC